MNNILLVFLGGGLGSLVRYGISVYVRNNYSSSFPWATLCSNILSCVILALTIGYFSQKAELSSSLKTLLVVGFCGGFSTFSSFSYETVELMRSGDLLFAILNILISVSVCMILIYFITKQSV
jgi:CrcB protein